jgi:hypothetical protein
LRSIEAIKFFMKSPSGFIATWWQAETKPLADRSTIVSPPRLCAIPQSRIAAMIYPIYPFIKMILYRTIGTNMAEVYQAIHE